MNYQNFLPAFLACCLPIFLEAQQMQPITDDAANKRYEPSARESLKLNKGQLDDFNMQVYRLTSAIEDRDAKTVELMKNLLLDAMQREIEEAQQALQADPLKVERVSKQQLLLEELKAAAFSVEPASLEKTRVLATRFEAFAKLMAEDLADAERAIPSEKH